MDEGTSVPVSIIVNLESLLGNYFRVTAGPERPFWLGSRPPPRELAAPEPRRPEISHGHQVVGPEEQCEYPIRLSSWAMRVLRNDAVIFSQPKHSYPLMRFLFFLPIRQLTGLAAPPSMALPRFRLFVVKGSLLQGLLVTASITALTSLIRAYVVSCARILS